MRETRSLISALEAILGIIILLLALVTPSSAPSTLQKRTAESPQTSTGRAAGSGRAASAHGSLRIMTEQAGSVAFLNDVRNGVTSDSGELKLDRISAGSYSVRIRTVGYDDWSGRVLIRAQAETRLQVKQVRNSDQAVLHYQKGDALRDAANHEEAVAEYKQALQISPRIGAAAIGCARSLIALQQFEDAESMLQRAVKLSAGRQLAEAETVLGNLRRSQELLDESISHYRKALALVRGISPEAHIGLALALEEKGAMDEAIAHFRQGLAQDMDTEPILYYLLGKALEKTGRNKEAIDAYGGYLRLDPDGQYSSAVQSIIEQLRGK
jgi:tetratricopeptide (TPR) repeat protein